MGYLSHLRFYLMDAVAHSYNPDTGTYDGDWDIEVRKTSVAIDELVAKGTVTIAGVSVKPGHDATKMYWERRFLNE